MNDFIWKYAKNQALQDIKIFNQEASRSTGFPNLDSEMKGFPPCVGLLVASSSVGKTSFAIQLGDQLAQRGENVIYVGYETSNTEVLSRILARRMFLLNPGSTFSAYDVMCDRACKDSTFQQAFNDITNNTQWNFRVWNPPSNEGIPWIINKLKQSIHNEPHLKKPFVINDYIQILPHSGDIKPMLDREIPKLKQFQMETNCTILMISSTSRSNYYRSLTLGSSKEAGVLESSSSIVLGLQMSVLNRFVSETMSEDQFEEYKRQDIRKMTLKCLKHRHGGDFDVFFDYYPQYELFVVQNKKHPEK